MIKPKQFWGVTSADIIKMKYSELVPFVRVASGLSDEEIVVSITKRRQQATGDAETLACSRIISAFIDGPDVVEF